MSRLINILGSTGSVGSSTLDVIAANPEEFRVQALTAQTNVEKLAVQAKSSGAALAVIGDESKYADLKNLLAGTDIVTAAGVQAIIDAAARPADVTMAAIVGMAGLNPILAAIDHSKHVAIANKEPLVAAGALVMAAADKSGAVLLPVDSEHNAIFQVFEQANRDRIERIILTASGGPFREWSEAQMAQATPAQALAHPNWVMGRKISIDSATMMNKALEVIEAHHLFAMPPEKIDVLLHPQSIVHSMVEYDDGSILAQMGASDMRVPIAHALGWPGRLKGAAQRLDFTKFSTLNFAEVDHRRFPAIKLAYDCIGQGGASCVAFNAANEVAVDVFLNGGCAFPHIVGIVQDVLDSADFPRLSDIDSIVDFDSKMRRAAQNCIVKLQTQTRKAP